MIKRCRVDLDNDQGYSEIIYNVISIKVKNGMVDILSKDRHRVFRDDEVTLFIEILLDNSLP